MTTARKSRVWRGLLGAAAAATLLAGTEAALAVTPVAKAVPFVPANPLSPHTALSGQPTRLKGTSSIGQGDNGVGGSVSWIWDTGGGDPAQCSGTVTSTTKYAIECPVTYTGTPGQLFTGTLTVTDDATGHSATVNYFSQIQAPSLGTDVNIAIDEGLWYLHKRMSRSTCSTNAAEPCGGWQGVPLPSSNTSFNAIDPANVTAFLVNGHAEGGAATNPYTETVERGINTTLEQLSAVTVSNQNTTVGTFDPDVNGNGIGLQGDTSDPPYQGGLFIDALVATGTPAKTADAGSAASSGTEASIVQGRTYADIVQDMVDAYSWGQSEGGGGWRYSWYNNGGGTTTDNSTNQWAAIGLIAAEREFGSVVPSEVRDMNQLSLTNTQQASGVFGYTSTSPIWGPYATTPSGMVQLAWQGIGRGDDQWDRSENYIRNNFCNTGGASRAIKDYYYGLFSFTKSMLLHESSSGAPTSLDCLVNTGGGNPLDWYGAESGQPDTLCNAGTAAPCDGVAREIVDSQNGSGTGASWGAWPSGNQYTSSQYPFTSTWAIIMLNRTVFSSGEPVAVCSLRPNPSIAGQPVTLDGTNSFHQDAAKSIIAWEWDTDNDGVFDETGAVVSDVDFPAAVGVYPVTLRVTDDSDPADTATTVCNVTVDTPPLAPTADANGPYVFCLGQNFFLDGTGSTNPDDGEAETDPPPAGCPNGDSITAYDWDLDGDGQFDDASGAQAEVTDFYTQVGAFNASLRVQDDSAACFPTVADENLTGFDVGEANVFALGAQECECVSDLFIRSNSRAISLNWAASNNPETDSYNVYRGTTAGGPYNLIGNTPTPGYADSTAAAGTTYYYIVRPIRIDTSEICQSNEGSGQLQARRSRR